MKMRPLKAVHLLVVGKAIRTRGNPSGELKRQGILSQFREFTSPRAKPEVDVYNEDQEETPTTPSAAVGNVRREEGYEQSNEATEADEHEDVFIDAIDFDEEHE